MSIVPICELKPLRNDMKIKVRICQMWTPNIFGCQNQFNGSQCVLFDELLHSHSNKQTFKVVPHTAQVYFNGKTTFKQIPEKPPHILARRFYLVDYSELLSRVDKVEILTGN
ncbi:hypothetical protein ACFX13_013689 [Malus domestica]